jgi:hypothetical protein
VTVIEPDEYRLESDPDLDDTDCDIHPDGSRTSAKSPIARTLPLGEPKGQRAVLSEEWAKFDTNGLPTRR